MIRAITLKDISKLAILHKEVLPSFLAVFPLGFIQRFYSSQLSRKNQLLLGYFDEDNLVGFVFGTDNVDDLYSNFIHENKVYFYTQTLLAIAKNPKYILLFVSKLFSRPFKSPCKRQLVYIAVSKQTIKRGLGSLLVQTLERHWEQFGYYELEVESSNKAYSFYQKHNFYLVHQYNNWVETKLLLGKKLP